MIQNVENILKNIAKENYKIFIKNDSYFIILFGSEKKERNKIIRIIEKNSELLCTYYLSNDMITCLPKEEYINKSHKKPISFLIEEGNLKKQKGKQSKKSKTKEKIQTEIF